MMNKQYTTGRKVLWGLKFVVLGGLFFTLVSLAVMGLWNWLLPGIFGLPVISFLQAAGLMALSRILLGGFGRHKRGHHGGHHHWRKRFAEKWEKMTPEERAKWQNHMGHWSCCHKAQEPVAPPQS
jgi:hypothetical protein